MARTRKNKIETLLVGSSQQSAGQLSYPKDRQPLSSRQRETLSLLERFIGQHSYPPTVLELADLLGVSSPNAVSEHLRALQRKNYITLTPGASRGIAINNRCDPMQAVALLRELVEDVPGAKQRALTFLGMTGERR